MTVSREAKCTDFYLIFNLGWPVPCHRAKKGDDDDDDCGVGKKS